MNGSQSSRGGEGSTHPTFTSWIMGSLKVVRDCQYCAEIRKDRDTNLSTSQLYEAFHADCHHCAKARAIETSLCPSCAHLRFRHLSVCYRPKTSVMIPLGRVEDIRNRPECSLCRMISHAAENSDGEVSPSTQLLIEFKVLGVHDPGVWNAYSGERHQAAYCELWPNFATLSVSNLDSMSSDDVKSAGLIPLTERIINWSPIKNRIDQCVSSHLAKCAARPSAVPKNFRVIDVNNRRLVEMPQGCRYVALSYVWGANPSPSFHLTTHVSISSYREVGGLDATRMPKTIEDAMHVCIQLQEKYLWTDRLCIIQDDTDDMNEQIQAMSSIYSSAVFVVIGVDGDHMDAGLTGISRPRREQIHDTIEGLLVNVVGRHYLRTVNKGVWFTRGWTYQEGILTARKLYFSLSQLLFECESEVWHEDPLSFGHGNINKVSLEYQSPSFEMGLYGGRPVPFGEYVRHLRAYRARRLTHQSDAYNAFTGILNALYHRDDIRYGMPLPDLDQALLWQCHDSAEAGLPSTIHYINDSKDMTLPTWSWGSIMGNIFLETANFQGTLVSWRICSTQGPLQNIQRTKPWNAPLSWIKQDHPWTNKKTSGRVSVALAWMEGCFEASPLDVPSWRQISFSELDKQLTFRWPTYHDFHNEAFGAGVVDESSAQEKRVASDSDVQLTPGTLIGRAQMATFQITTRASTSRGLSVIDDQGKIVGMVNKMEPRVMSEVASRIDCEDSFEFIALSVAFDDHYIPGRPDVAYDDVNGETLERPLTVAVMVIGRREPYVYRVTTGRIYLRDWVRAKPQFRDILLV